jgi:signal transduction histidine kinase/AraC-like DNA-binding protein/AmiR/NasT family two-component response regulator
VIDEFMWLATANGVFKLDYQKNIDNSYKLSLVETLDLNNGLDNEFINSIVKVENNTSELGSYWFSSMIKVVNYNEKSGGLIEYGGMDGIDVQMFNLGASFQHNDDKIYFGASNDLIELDLKKISKDKNDGKVIFTHLKINQSKIYPNQEYNDRIVLNKNLSYLNEITLTDKERSFSVGFVNNDFNERNKFAYKLIGYQDQWINLGHVKEIDFTGLSSSLFSDGKYKLIVASSLDNVNWENSSELLINIKPSPFLSFPALMIYILTLILLFYLIIRIYSNGLKLKSSLINSEKDKKREMDFAESKLGFFTNISHEFRTPLTLIISPIQEILNSTDLKANVSNKLTTVEKNANKLLNLINELLDFRKADHGLLKIKVAYGNFKNFSHEIFLLFNELAKSKNIEYEFICNEDEINLPFDRNKIEIVISNLISNALKFTPSGGKITVMVSSANGYCNCSVRDTGIGIPVKDVDKIFDEFYMVKSKLKNQTPGTGIGLFLSKKIIELHHGSINVLSDYGDGSEFIFSISMDANNYREVDLNFKKSEDLSVYHLENNTNSINNVSIESRETILVIDDNKDIRTYLNSLLSDNYEIIEAENGEVGLKLALSKIPDLIISDIMMPVMDGIELCSKLKKELSTSHIPIILLTARNSTLFEVSGFESGADDYITKPFKANILKARVTSLLDNRNNTRKHLLNKVRFEPVIDPNSNDDVEIGFIEKAIVLVEENIQNPNFGIDKMTDYFCMSQSTLYRKIKSLTGLSLTAFIRSVRLKKAAYLISTTDTKLTYVCYEVGFNDYKYFRTSFKQQFGCLPSKYKSSKVDTINQNI